MEPKMRRNALDRRVQASALLVVEIILLVDGEQGRFRPLMKGNAWFQLESSVPDDGLDPHRHSVARGPLDASRMLAVREQLIKEIQQKALPDRVCKHGNHYRA
jgi:hypothetical protein